MKKLKNKIVLILLILIALLLIALTPTSALSEQETIELPAEDQNEVIHTPVENGHAVDIANTIAIIETRGSGDCSAQIGLSGEKGCHQFLPSTWALYSKEVFGRVVTQTDENAIFVTESMISKWIKQGLSDRQIFLIWNQGNTGKCKAGVNSKGVKYDSCAYVENALKVLQGVINSR